MSDPSKIAAPLSMDQAADVAASYAIRRNRWPGEDERMSLMVVLMNWGDGYTPVRCINGEWSGTKADMPTTSGLPLCPNGHPLLEGRDRWRLGLVYDPLPDFSKEADRG